jgi:hypothetical protein
LKDRTKAEQPTEDGFVNLSTYSQHEASELLQRFEQSGIAFRAQTKKTAYYLKTKIVISVEAAQAGEAAEIHRELFGDGLPNDDFSFFRERRNVYPYDRADREPGVLSGFA